MKKFIFLLSLLNLVAISSWSYTIQICRIPLPQVLNLAAVPEAVMPLLQNFHHVFIQSEGQQWHFEPEDKSVIPLNVKSIVGNQNYEGAECFEVYNSNNLDEYQEKLSIITDSLNNLAGNTAYNPLANLQVEASLENNFIVSMAKGMGSDGINCQGASLNALELASLPNALPGNTNVVTQNILNGACCIQ